MRNVDSSGGQAMPDVVIGMGLQRAYLHVSGSCYVGEHAEVLKVRIKEFLKTLPSQTVVMFTKEIHAASDTFFRRGKTHSVVGSDDIEILEVFKSFAKVMINVTRPDAFFKTPLESELHKRKPRKVTLIGVETHSNILFTASGLRSRDYEVVVPEALVWSADDYMHIAGINILSNVLSVDVE